MSRLLRGQGQNLHCRHPGPLQQAERGMLAARQRAPPPPTPKTPARTDGANASRRARGRREEAGAAGDGTPGGEEAEVSADEAHDWGARLRDEAWASDDDDAAWSTYAGACRGAVLAACLAACACGGGLYASELRQAGCSRTACLAHRQGHVAA